MAMRAVDGSARPAGKVLRIGLLRDGTIIEERVIRKRETVLIGTAEDNHFVIKADGFPTRFALFQLVGDDYILNFTDRMSGRLALAGGISQLDELRRTGGARDAGDYFQVKLSDQAKGRITIGSLTFLFQFVDAPVELPKPKLPAAIRSGYANQIDWTFTSFLVASFLFFFGSGIMLEALDPVVEATEVGVPPQFARLLFDEPPAPVEPLDVDPIDDEEGDEAAEEVVEAPTRPTTPSDSRPSAPSDAPSSAAERSEAKARIVASAAARAESLIMGVLGDGGGALADALATGAVTSNAMDVLASAAGVAAADGTSAGQLRAREGGGGSGQTGSLGEITQGGGGGKQITTKGPTEKAVTGKVGAAKGSAVGGSGDFDASKVLEMVRSRMSAIKSCYDRALRSNPKAEGRVRVEFTIQPNGTVTNARALENTTGSDEVANCVTSTVSRFRFSDGPSGGSVTFSYPFVFQLQS